MYSDFTNCFSFTFLLPILIVTFTSVIFILWGRVNYQIQMYSPILAQGFLSVSHCHLHSSCHFYLFFIISCHFQCWMVFAGHCAWVWPWFLTPPFTSAISHFYLPLLFCGKKPSLQHWMVFAGPSVWAWPWIPYSLPTLTTFTCHIHFLLFYTYFFNSPDLNGLIFNLYFYLLFYFIYFI